MKSKNDFNLPDYYELVGKDNLLTDEIMKAMALKGISLVGRYDHVAELADVRSEIDLGKDKDGNPIYQHVRFDGEVFQEGTPVSAENLGQMEWNDLINFIKIKALEDAVASIQIQLATLAGENASHMPYNSFVASAKNIDSDIVVIEGYYDETNGRVVM